jgi:hypothetical protein
MIDPLLPFTVVLHLVFARLHQHDRPAFDEVEPTVTDRGAVSIEHVLWYAAAAVSVAVVAAIIWSQVRTTASTPVQTPSAP